MDAGYKTSLSLIALWLLIGFVFYFYWRGREKQKRRREQIEQELALWVESRKKAGIPAADIVSQLEEKRREIAADHK